jgi:hypothetical protein
VEGNLVQTGYQRLMRQPAVGATTAGAALVGLALAWAGALAHSSHRVDEITFLVGILLVGALVLAQLFPIHIHENTKVHMGSVLFYLMAVLLPPPIAGVAALTGTLVGEVLLRSQRGLYPSDIATQVGRWTVIVVLGSVLAHLQHLTGTPSALPLVGAAVCLWAGDLVTTPLLLTPITGKSPGSVIVALVKEGGAVEAGQYLVGILGAVVAQEQVWAIVLLCVPTAMIYVTGKRNKELQDQTQALLEHMADTVDLRDPYTGGHSRRVTELTRGILRELGIQGPDVALIVTAARVHDIGKLAMPDSVLLKAGKLTDEDWAIMKRHPEQGADLLMRYPDFSRGASIVRHHHERWDGEGYPHRLREQNIPFGARVIAVADSYDAMTSDRPYRRGMPPGTAAAVLREGRGTQWDPAIVEAFLRSVADRLEQPAGPRLHVVPNSVAAAPGIVPA